MKKLFFALMIVFSTVLFSCGPSEAEIKAEAEKAQREADSIKKADELKQASIDSVEQELANEYAEPEDTSDVAINDSTK